MLAGSGIKAACSPSNPGGKPTQFFDVGKSISFGEREEPHKRPAGQGKAKGKGLRSLGAKIDQFMIVSVFILSALVGVLGVLAGVDQILVQQLGYASPSSSTQILLSVVLLVFAYVLFALGEKFGSQVFDEATPASKKHYIKPGQSKGMAKLAIATSTNGILRHLNISAH